MAKEKVIDIILATNIIVCTFKTYRKENSPQHFENKILKIIFNYCVKGSFVFDLLSVVPTLATN